MLALIEFDLQYVPTKVVKGQVIADFHVDNSKDLNDQVANIVDVEVNYWKLYFDGSKHKDGAGVGILIISPEGIPSEFLFELKYPCSNNVAEYEALILGLKILIDKGALEVQILGDSQLVLKQLSKEFKCNNETLQKYLVTAWELLTSFQKVSLVHIPRIHNEIANELAQIASRYRIGLETIKKLSSIHQILVPANERELMSSRNISMVTLTPYYAQANGQVEAANKILIGLIKKYIGSKPQTWNDTLSQVLWAYRNSPRGSIGTSPYKLVYGHDAVLSLEINLNTLRLSKQNDLPVDDYWNAMFDELNELDLEQILALENIIRQKESVARSYNRQIKEKSFKIGELVFKVILPMEKKSRFLGKWSHSWEGPFQIIGTYSGNAYQIKDIESGNCQSRQVFGLEDVALVGLRPEAWLKWLNFGGQWQVVLGFELILPRVLLLLDHEKLEQK
ncbi:uncharacterized protein [Arachis hypogaea]|uniref:uncharacterized protein n=1 Tax=Arachis hypogaea TaxID=3818 RepID=UPI003B20E02A